MGLVMVEYVPRGWLRVVPIEPTIGYILPGGFTCVIIALSSRVDSMIDCIACIDKTTTDPVSPPSRY